MTDLAIQAEHNDLNEQDVENRIIDLARNIAACYSVRKQEYMSFIQSENVSVRELETALNRVRLIHKLYALSENIINDNGIGKNIDDYKPITKEFLLQFVQDVQNDVGGIQKRIQKIYNDAIDIDDEEEYQKVQSKIREKRKKFRSLNELCDAYRKAVENYVPVVLSVSLPEENSEDKSQKSDAIPAIPSKTRNLPLTEEAFFDWLIKHGGVVEKTAQNYINGIHKVEEIYQSLFGIKRNLFGKLSKDSAKEMIESIIREPEFLEENNKRHYQYSAALSKYAKFVDFTVEACKSSAVKKSEQKPDAKTADLKQKKSALTGSELTDKIIDVIKRNKDNIQYADGFGAYEVKTLLSNDGINGVSEDDIEKLMSLSDKLQKEDDGCYTYIDLTPDRPTEQTFAATDHIVLKLNGNMVRSSDHSEALCQICEFAIRYKPFKMARISAAGFWLEDNYIFCRNSAPVDGYVKLSNELQVLRVNNSSRLNYIADKIKEYCQIDDDMIKIICE